MNKELEALKRIHDATQTGLYYTYDQAEQDHDIVKKSIRALDIIKRHPVPILLMAVIEKYIMELNYTWEKYEEVFKDEPIEDREIKCKEEYELLKEVFKR